MGLVRHQRQADPAQLDRFELQAAHANAVSPGNVDGSPLGWSRSKAAPSIAATALDVREREADVDLAVQAGGGEVVDGRIDALSGGTDSQ